MGLSGGGGYRRRGSRGGTGGQRKLRLEVGDIVYADDVEPPGALLDLGEARVRNIQPEDVAVIHPEDFRQQAVDGGAVGDDERVLVLVGSDDPVQCGAGAGRELRGRTRHPAGARPGLRHA